jgi:hypothetical protein
MTSTTIADYIKEILDRHPGLSMRKASLQAGLNENEVQQIIKGDRPTPRPDTLKAITDTWGTLGDYIELMRLAGYEIPLSPDFDDPEEAELLALFRDLPPKARDYVLKILRSVSGKDMSLPDELREPDITPIALRAGQLDAQGRRAILEMMEYVIKAQRADKKDTGE